MSLLLAIFIGVATGVVGGLLLQNNYELLLLNSGAGLVGAIIGDAIYFFSSGNSLLQFTAGGTLSQLAGALLAVLIVSLFHRVTPDVVKDSNTRHIES